MYDTISPQSKDRNEYERILRGCSAIELAHTASLIHDDIIDNDNFRRGKRTLHSMKGLPTALIYGHQLITVGFRIALEFGDSFTDLYINTWKNAVNGEIEEINFSHHQNSISDISKKKLINKYYSVLSKKTSSLFSASCQSGAILANADRKTINLADKIGNEIGLAYQLADDFIDLQNGDYIDSILLPLFSSINHSKNVIPTNIEKIENTIENNHVKINKFYDYRIKYHLKKAKSMISSGYFPNSQYKEYLLEMPDFIVNKMYSAKIKN